MISAVLDTNVLVSAFIVKHGNPARILQSARKFQMILCAEILAEVSEVFGRRHIQKRFHPSPADIDGYLDRLRAISRMAGVTQIENVIPHDPPDNLILACAREDNTDYLVSGNDHLLALRQYHHTQIVSPAQFLAILDALPGPGASA